MEQAILKIIRAKSPAIRGKPRGFIMVPPLPNFYYQILPAFSSLPEETGPDYASPAALRP
jgi:hypothetical protein